MGRLVCLTLLLALLAAPAQSSADPASEAAAAAALFERGKALFAEQRREEAWRKLQAAYRLAPDDRTRILLGRVLVSLERCDEALPLLRAVQVDSLIASERDAARSDLAAALERCGSSPEEEKAAALLLERAQDRFAVKQYEGARRDLEMARKIAPGDLILLWLGYVYEASGNCESALHLYRHVDIDNLPTSEREDAGERIRKGREACRKPPMDMVFVPGGAFHMGAERGGADERPRHEITLAPYLLDRTEVTVERYQECVNAGGCPEDGFLSNGPAAAYCNYGAPQREQHPMNCVRWDGAVAFCEWAGRRLPTEAEWERAARGTDERPYPWGSEPATCERCVMKSEAGDGCSADRTWEVGSRPHGVSELGIFDLAGNVWEWVQDWYAADYYAISPPRDPRGPTTGTKRVIRGGSWLSETDGAALRSTVRRGADPEEEGNGVGFRCARDAEREQP